MTQQTVEIPLVRLTELLHAEKVLNALYAGGVDNWEWYDASLEDIDFYEDDD